jgi:DNA-binding beta-propeller fold protein YncE
VTSAEGSGEGVGRAVSNIRGDTRKTEIVGTQMVSSEGHSPVREVLQRSLPERVVKGPCKCGPGQAADRRQLWHAPGVTGLNVATNTIVDTIDVANGPQGVTMVPGGQYAWINVENSDVISVLDLFRQGCDLLE